MRYLYLAILFVVAAIIALVYSFKGETLICLEWYAISIINLIAFVYFDLKEEINKKK